MKYVLKPLLSKSLNLVVEVAMDAPAESEVSIILVSV